MDRRRAVHVVVAAVTLATWSGCGNSGEETDARRAVTRFVSALEQRDGGAACDELTEAAQSELERQEQAACEESILSLELAPSPVSDAEVWLTSARVDLEGGDAVFLDETSGGWKIGAVGCEARPGQPYECDLEA